ncbi:hypothetical protein EWM64_g7438 [Hericium alpestre]|uniref:Fungal N-terminal domain-containing protein n=1 Tax=Hericium alpestre TaxID=135208 RepID=A0A4Y9ZRC0_9AGAM|nr:hypothetical protein EWM64_g7438 [Hericium alpestre]
MHLFYGTMRSSVILAMPAIAFTFGAFGDIFSLIQLARSVQKALSESAGASMEYQDLVMEVDSFIKIVNCVHRTMSFHGPNRLPPSVENALNASLAICSVLIGKIGNKIIDYRESLRKGGGTRMMLDSWRKIGWGLFAKNEMIDLQRRLAEQVEVMNTLLTLAHGHALSRTEENSREQLEIIREMHHCLKKNPNVLGYTWEGAPNPGEEPVLFTDFCGHSVSVPSEFCLSGERFKRFQNFYFSDRPGLKIVNFEFTSFSHRRPRRKGEHPRIELAFYMEVCVKYATVCPICQKAYPGAKVTIGFSVVCIFSMYREETGINIQTLDSRPGEAAPTCGRLSVDVA